MTAGLCNVIKLQLFFSLTGSDERWSGPEHPSTNCLHVWLSEGKWSSGTFQNKSENHSEVFFRGGDAARNLWIRTGNLQNGTKSITSHEALVTKWCFIIKLPPNDEVKQFRVCRVSFLISMFSLYEGVLTLTKPSSLCWNMLTSPY